MKSFSYIITDPLGIHARPAGLLARTAQNYAGTTITVEKDGSIAGANQLIRLMGMGVKQGDRVTVTAEGVGEDAAIEAMRSFFHSHL